MQTITHRSQRFAISSALLLSLALLFSCKKSEGLLPNASRDEAAIEKFLQLPADAGKSLQAIAADIRKREARHPFLSGYIAKNGYPLWSEVLSNLPVSGSGHYRPSSHVAQKAGEEPSGAGVFFIPLQHTAGGAISAYLVAYKKDDTTFRYKSYNRNDIEALSPASDSIRKNGADILSVFGHFEKRINDVSDFTVGAPYQLAYRDVRMAIREASTAPGAQAKASVVMPACMHVFEAEVTIEYPDGTTETKIYTIVINDCGSGGGEGTAPGGNGGWSGGSGGAGGTGGGSGSGTGSGSGSGGTYWDENCQCMALDPWWDGSDPHQAIAQQLDGILAPGDSYSFDNVGLQCLYFTSVAEFHSWLSGNANGQADLNVAPNLLSQNNKIEHGKFSLTLIGGVDISCKLERVGSFWELSQITSTEYGVTLGWSWDQQNYSQTSSGNQITAIVEGYCKYNIILEGIGTVYKKYLKFQIRIDKTTGKITSLSKL